MRTSKYWVRAQKKVLKSIKLSDSPIFKRQNSLSVNSLNNLMINGAIIRSKVGKWLIESVDEYEEWVDKYEVNQSSGKKPYKIHLALSLSCRR